jgi:hypothetical protein
MTNTTTKTKTPRVRKPKNAPIGLKRVGDKDHKVDLSHYARVKSASGNASLDNGDAVAKQLRELTIDDVYSRASKVLKEPVTALKARYKHLNVGMQRMNLGNRIRGAQAE